jgi:hypothetical protein
MIFNEKDLFSIDSVGNVFDGKDERRNMPSTESGSDLLTDFVDDFLLELVTFRHLQEEDDALLAVDGRALSDAETVGDDVERFDDVVDFGAAEADAVRVEGSVRPAEHHHSAGTGIDDEEVTVCPDSFKLVEVGRVVLLAIGIVPEVHRH